MDPDRFRTNEETAYQGIGGGPEFDRSECGVHGKRGIPALADQGVRLAWR